MTPTPAAKPYEIGMPVEILVIRTEPNFDRACDAAMDQAIRRFGVDSDGHFTKVEGAERSNSWIEIDFSKLRMTGRECVYRFVASVEQSPDDNEE